MSDTLYVLAVLSALIAATEWLVRNTIMRHAGTAILVILVTATATGVVIAMWMIDGRETIGPLFHAIGGMFTSTYSGGSVNFNAIALHYNVTSDVIVVHGRRGNRQYYDHSLDGRNARRS